jgi:hypothetical protein
MLLFILSHIQNLIHGVYRNFSTNGDLETQWKYDERYLVAHIANAISPLFKTLSVPHMITYRDHSYFHPFYRAIMTSMCNSFILYYSNFPPSFDSLFNKHITQDILKEVRAELPGTKEEEILCTLLL